MKLSALSRPAFVGAGLTGLPNTKDRERSIIDQIRPKAGTGVYAVSFALS